VLLAAGTKTYQHGADFHLEDLDGVESALGRVVETLTGLGYEPEPTAARRYLLNPSLQRLRQAVRAAAGSAPVVVVYYTGHGMKRDKDTDYLITTEARPGALEDTTLEASQLLRLVVRRDVHGDRLSDDEQPQVLVILDCCFSGAGATEALQDSLQGRGNPKVWWLASASSLEYAQQGRFADALKQALRDPEAGPAQEFLGLEWMLGKINATLRSVGQQASFLRRPAVSPGGRRFSPTPTTPRPTPQPGSTSRAAAGGSGWWRTWPAGCATPAAAGWPW
jgi:hypothetical protein